ncbi:MAG: toll/interleukin-1 receptor domain-containing protein [Vitreimonas sp.]
MADVFLSYKSEDRDLVWPIAQALEREGIGVWWDLKISAGGTWRETITAALDQSKVVIVVWSKRTEDSAAAAWVFNEVDEAQRLRRPIIPVQIEPCAIPLGYRHVQCANLSGWRGDPKNPEWQEVLSGVRTAMTGRRIGAAVPNRSHPAPRRSGVGVLIGLVGLAMLCTIGVLGYMVLSRPTAPPQLRQTQVASTQSVEANPQTTQTIATTQSARSMQTAPAPVVNHLPAPIAPHSSDNVATVTQAPPPDTSAQSVPSKDVSTDTVAIADAIASGRPFRVTFNVPGDPCPVSGDAYYTREGSIVATGGVYDVLMRRGTSADTRRWIASGPDQATCQVVSNTHITSDNPAQHSFSIFGRPFSFDDQGVVYDNNNSSDIFDVGHDTPPFSRARRVGRIELRPEPNSQSQ